MTRTKKKGQGCFLLKRYSILGVSSRRAQNSLEFLAMFGVIIVFTLAVMAFVFSKISVASAQREDILLGQVLDDVRNEIRQAMFATDGYTKSFSLKSKAAELLFNISIRNTAEVYVNNTRGYQQIIFLKPEEFVQGNICRGKNEIVKSADYGIGVCCGSCNGSVPNVNYGLPIECKTNSSVYWSACTNLVRGNNWTQIRVNCSIWMSGANITVINQSGGNLLANTSTSHTNMRNLSINWVVLTLPTPVLASSSLYNISTTCYNRTASYNQNNTFTVS